jgi:hypothetical protein
MTRQELDDFYIKNYNKLLKKYSLRFGSNKSRIYLSDFYDHITKKNRYEKVINIEFYINTYMFRKNKIQHIDKKKENNIMWLKDCKIITLSNFDEGIYKGFTDLEYKSDFDYDNDKLYEYVLMAVDELELHEKNIYKLLYVDKCSKTRIIKDYNLTKYTFKLLYNKMNNDIREKVLRMIIDNNDIDILKKIKNKI